MDSQLSMFAMDLPIGDVMESLNKRGVNMKFSKAVIVMYVEAVTHIICASIVVMSVICSIKALVWLW
jgi:hypothetical protein